MELPWPNAPPIQRDCFCSNRSLPMNFKSKTNIVEVHFTVLSMNPLDDYNSIFFEGTWDFAKAVQCLDKRRVGGPSGEIKNHLPFEDETEVTFLFYQKIFPSQTVIEQKCNPVTVVVAVVLPKPPVPHRARAGPLPVRQSARSDGQQPHQVRDQKPHHRARRWGDAGLSVSQARGRGARQRCRIFQRRLVRQRRRYAPDHGAGRGAQRRRRVHHERGRLLQRVVARAQQKVSIGSSPSGKISGVHTDNEILLNPVKIV